MRLVFLFVLFFFSINCYSQKVKVVQTEDFYELLNHDDNYYLFDIRPIEEYKVNRIGNAFWAGRKDSLKMYLKDIQKQETILLYCEFGQRTKQCSKWLRSEGYKKIYELKGGILEWLKDGYPVDSTRFTATEKVDSEQ